MLSLLLPELRAQFSGMGNNALVILPGKRRKKSNNNKNAKMAPFGTCFGGLIGGGSMSTAASGCINPG
jgi:hypothetical protein